MCTKVETPLRIAVSVITATWHSCSASTPPLPPKLLTWKFCRDVGMISIKCTHSNTSVVCRNINILCWWLGWNSVSWLCYWLTSVRLKVDVLLHNDAWVWFPVRRWRDRIQELHVCRHWRCVHVMCMRGSRGREGNKQEDCINLWSAGEGRAQAGPGWLKGHPIIRLLSALFPGD